MQESSNIKKIWRVIYPPVLYFVIQIIVQMIFTIAILCSFRAKNKIMNCSSIEAYNHEVTSYIFQFAIAITLTAAVISLPIFVCIYRSDNRKIQAETGISYGKMNPVYFLLIAILGATCSGGFNKLVSILAAFLPSAVQDNFEKVAQALSTGNIWIQILTTAAIVPMVEELIFRGLVYRRLKFLVSTKMAMILSGLIFGIAHGNLIQGFYAFILGVFLAWIYETCKTIWAPIVFHMMANGFSELLQHSNLFQPVSNGMIFLWMIGELIVTCFICILIHKNVKIEKKEEEIKKEEKYIW